MLKQIDLTNLNHITFIIILIIIFFCIIYLFKVNKHNASIEGFKQYDVNIDDAVKLYSLDNIIVGGNGESLTTTLNDAYADRRDYLINKQSIVNQLNKFKDEIQLNINTIKTNIEKDTQDSLKIFENNLESLKSTVSMSSPPLTIVAFYNNVIPTGWQLCDGSPFTAMDGTRVYYKITSSGDPVELNTPDLRGRMILGANATYTGVTANGLTIKSVGNIGGAETHKLLLTEMPAHTHKKAQTQSAGISNFYANYYTNVNASYGGHYGSGDTAFFTGGDPTLPPIPNYDAPDNTNLKVNDTKPHNNMPPFYVLNYIIKKPLFGGSSNAIEMTSSPTPPTPTGAR